MALEAPQDHHLEGTIEGKRIGEPALAERVFHPVRGRRRRADDGDDARGTASLHVFDALKVRAVKEPRCIGLDDRMPVRLQTQGRRGDGCRRQVVAQDDLSRAWTISRPSDRAPRSSTGANNRPSRRTALPASAAHGRFAAVEDNALQHAQAVDAQELQPRIVVQGRVAEPLEHQGHRQHGPAVEDVGLQDGSSATFTSRSNATGSDTASAGNSSGQVVTGVTGGPRTTTSGSFAAAADFVHEVFRPGRQRDDADPFRGEDAFQLRRNHAAVPRSPVDGHDPTPGQTPRVEPGVLVQYFVGHGVVDLPDPAETRGGGGEEDQDTQLLGFEASEERTQAANLRTIDAVELFVGLRVDPGVGENPGAVNQPPDRAELAADTAKQIGDSGAIAHVSTPVDDAAALGSQAVDGVAQLALEPSGAGTVRR